MWFLKLFCLGWILVPYVRLVLLCNSVSVSCMQHDLPNLLINCLKCLSKWFGCFWCIFARNDRIVWHYLSPKWSNLVYQMFIELSLLFCFSPVLIEDQKQKNVESENSDSSGNSSVCRSSSSSVCSAGSSPSLDSEPVSIF